MHGLGDAPRFSLQQLLPSFDPRCAPFAGFFTSPSIQLQSIFKEISFEYNASQQKAILTVASMIQSSISPKITMVQGPAGTGKSHTIVGLLCLIFDPRLVNNVAAAGDTKTFPIFVCAPSNTAVDQLLLRFANASCSVSSELQQRICCYGRFEAVAEDVRLGIT